MEPPSLSLSSRTQAWVVQAEKDAHQATGVALTMKGTELQATAKQLRVSQSQACAPSYLILVVLAADTVLLQRSQAAFA